MSLRKSLKLFRSRITLKYTTVSIMEDFKCAAGMSHAAAESIQTGSQSVFKSAIELGDLPIRYLRRDCQQNTYTQEQKNALAARLRLFRKNFPMPYRAKPCSQDYIARALNISRSCYTYFEQGKTIPNLFLPQRIPCFYGVTVDDLIGAYEQNELDLGITPNKLYIYSQVPCKCRSAVTHNRCRVRKIRPAFTDLVQTGTY